MSKMFYTKMAGFCVLLAVLSLQSSARAQVNSWTDPASAAWESMNWSLGVLPDSAQSIMITNAGYKAVGISPSTPINFPASMTVSNLTVSAPTNGFNTLLLNYSGTATPLTILDGCTIGTNGVIENLYGGFELKSGSWTIEGGEYIEQGGMTVSTNPYSFLDIFDGNISLSNAVFQWGSVEVEGGFFDGIFNTSAVTQVEGQTTCQLQLDTGGSYTLQSGIFSGACLFDGEEAQFSQYGGTNLGNITFGAPSSDSSGQYTIYNGLAVSSSIDVGGGEFGHGNFTQYGGTVITTFLGLGGAGDGVGLATGGYFLSNGVLQVAEIGIVNGGFTQAGGLLVTSNSLFVSGVPPVEYGPEYNAAFGLSGGQLSSPGVGVGPYGSFSQSGGSNGIEGDLDVSGSSYGLSGGILISSNTEISMSTEWDSFGFGPFGGELQQTGGTNNIAGNLLLSGGEYALSGGVLLDSFAASYPAAFVTTGMLGNQTNIFHGTFFQTGGQHRISNTLSNLDQYLISGGTLYASNIISMGTLSITNAAIVNPGLFECGGTLQLYGGIVENLGQMFLASNSIIELMPGSHKLTFLNSAAMNWNQSSLLLVSNWNGSTNGGGSDQLLFGNNTSGLTSTQLRQIVFVNPAGFPAGDYAARVLPAGEIVPLPNPILFWQSAQGQLVLSWAGQPTLQSSTNAAGPYTDLSNTSSPYTNNSIQGPNRFFRLRR